MAGAISAWVIRSAAASSRKARRANVRMITSVPDTSRMGNTTPHSPATWDHGMHRMDTSPMSNPSMPCQCRDEWTAPRCVSIAPFGWPVVPEV
jgi:hypothetical protein